MSIKSEFNCGCDSSCDWSAPFQGCNYIFTEGSCPHCWRENDDIDFEILTLRQASQNLDGGVVVCRFPRAWSEQLYTQIRTKEEVRNHGEPQPIHLPVAGVLHARMLYKLLPKVNNRVNSVQCPPALVHEYCGSVQLVAAR